MPNGAAGVIATFAIILVACSVEDDRTASPDIIIPAGSWPALSLSNSPEVKLGSVLESTDDQFASITGGDRRKDGSFVLLDRMQQRVLVYDQNGSFLTHLGRTGAGPGEFSRAQKVFRDHFGNTVIWDSEQRKLIRFGAGLEYEGQEFLLGGESSVSLFARSGGALVALFEATDRSPGYGPKSNIAALVRFQGEQVDTIAVFPGIAWHLTLTAEGGMRIDRPWYYRRLHATHNSEGIWLSTGLDWTIEIRDLDSGEVAKTVSLDLPLSSFPRSSLEEELPGIPELLPPVADLEVDSEGRVWVGRRNLPVEHLPSGMGEVISDWIVLSPDGETVVGVVSLPSRRRFLSADRYGILTVSADVDFDTPIVEWWPFETVF